MIALLVFWMMLFGALSIGWQAGDRADRRVIAAIAVAAALTAAAHLEIPGRMAYGAVVAIDAVLITIVVRYALRSSRHWPIWFAGFQGAAFAFDLAAFAFPPEARLQMGMMSGFWSMPALLAMVFGLLADRRKGIANPS